MLVTAMIALPVAALAFAAANYDTFRLTPDEQADRLMGTTQAAVIWPYDGPIAQHPTDTHFISDIFIRDPSSAPPPEPSRERLLALLPPGTGAISDQAGRLTVHTAAGTGNLRARMLDYADPLAAGIYRPLSGRAPASADEVALTPDAVRRIGTDIGGTVRLTDGSRAFRVVGIVEDPSDLAATTVVLHPSALPGEKLSTDRHDLRYLVATPGPLTWAQVKQLNMNGIVAISRHVLANPPSAAEVDLHGVSVGGGDDAALATGLIAGMAMLEIVLLAGPAFAVGARRRRRDLALVAAAGGTPAHVRRIVLADGVVLGVLAAATGVVLGVVVAAATVRLFEDVVVHARSGSFRVFPVALAILAGLAVATGVLAALVPAWISSRQDVVTALAGRRGITRSRRRWLVLGAALAAVGLAVAGAGAWGINWALILGGLVVVELGLVLCTPSIVGLVARLGRFLPLALRIALRDTSRNRTAAAPAISAVMAAVVGSLAIAVVGAASSERNRDENRSASPPGTVAVFNEESGGKGLLTGPQSFPPEVLEALRSNMPIAQLYEIDRPSCDPGLCFVTATPPAARDCPYAGRILQRRPTPAEQRAARRDPRCDGVGHSYIYFGGLGFDSLTVVIDESAAGAVANLPTEDVEPVVSALRAGAVVVSDPRMVDNGRVTLTIASFGSDDTRQTRTVSAPGFAVPHPLQAPITMMTKATASSLGLKATPFVLLATTTRMPTTAERDRTQAAVGERFPVLVEEGRRTDSVALLVLAVVAGVITLGAAAIATGLAAADGRADLGTLAAVGASPRVRRMLSLSQSGVIAGLGSLIGAVAGIGAALAILFALNQRYTELWPAPTPYPMAIPWLNVGIALVVVPLIAMLGAGLLTRSRLPIERRL